ncbi:MAG: oligosaccharide flippase family protein, partial [Desulfobacteraceae bacterium]|nr:oligosaccharide flippase family protein [Desulfobacteraceae bacterium]
MKNNQIRDHSFGKNAIFLILSKVSYIGASFILYIVLVQVLDRNQINIFGLAISFNSLFIIIADFGITEVVIRSSASCPREKLSSVFLSGLILKTIYAIAWYLLLYIVIKLIYHDVIMQKAIFIACFSALIRSFSEYIEGIATGVGKSGLVAVFTLIQYSLLLFLAVMAGVVFRWGVISVLYSYVIVMFVSLIMRLIWLVRYTKLKFNTLEVLESFMVYIKESPKFGIALITATINGAHLYLIIISLIDKTSNDLAVFQGGQKILALLHILGGMVGRSFYAAASNAIVLKNDYELKKLLQKATHYLAIISFGAIVLFTVMGQEIA